jgi:hypothetical protein
MLLHSGERTANAYFSTPVWSVYIWLLSILESDFELCNHDSGRFLRSGPPGVIPGRYREDGWQGRTRIYNVGCRESRGLCD